MTDPAAPTTPDDRKVYEELTGFTDHDIEIIARAVGVSDDTVYRLIDCIRFVKGQGLSEQRAQTARSTPAEALEVERLARAIQSTILTSPGKYTGPGMGAYRQYWEKLTGDQKRHVIGDAKALAAEYARLRSPESDR